MTFTDLGINSTVVRYVAHSYGLRDYELVRGYIRGLTKLKVLLALAVSILLFLTSDWLAFHVFHEQGLSLPLKIISLYVLFFSLSGYINAVFNAFNDFRSNFIKSLSYEVVRLFLIILLVSLGFSVVGALLGFVIASFFSLVILLLLLLKNYGKYVFGRAKRIDWKRIIRFTSYLTIGSITWVVFAYVDRL